jgi:hypothetical protein
MVNELSAIMIIPAHDLYRASPLVQWVTVNPR